MENETENKPKMNLFLVFIIMSVFVVISFSFYIFYFQKEYNFHIETSCDPLNEICFYRNCDISDECPPNNLFYYKQYIINAKDFDKCVNKDCSEICREGDIKCEEIQCTLEDFQNEICFWPVE